MIRILWSQVPPGGSQSTSFYSPSIWRMDFPCLFFCLFPQKSAPAPSPPPHPSAKGVATGGWRVPCA